MAFFVLILFSLLFVGGLVIVKYSQHSLEHLLWYVPSMAAILVGVLSIFKEDIKSKITKPRMEIDYLPEPPFFQKMPLVSIIDFEDITDAYSLKLQISNTKGKAILLNTEAQVEAVYRKIQNGDFRKTDLIPLNLRWSHDSKVEKERFGHIQPRMRAFVDFGNLLNVEDANFHDHKLYKKAKKRYPTAKVLFEIATVTAPTSGSSILSPGEYLVEIVFAASNHQLITKYYALTIHNSWGNSCDEAGKLLSFKEMIKKDFLNKLK